MRTQRVWEASKKINSLKTGASRKKLGNRKSRRSNQRTIVLRKRLGRWE